MKSDGERPGTETDRAVDEAERVLGHHQTASAPKPQSMAGDGFIALFAAMMVLCLVVFAVWFAAIPTLGVLPGVLVAVAVLAALWFAHGRLMGGHRH